MARDLVGSGTLTANVVTGERTGDMAVPQAAARTAFAAELLRAREFPTVAALASQAARQWFGLHSLRIVWFRPGHLEGYRPIRLAPGSTLHPVEQSLTLRALVEPNPVYVEN